MMPRERSGINNGIWLCKTCARKIDLDPIYYTAQLLKDWKNQAEKSAQASLGSPKSETETIDTLKQVLSGLPLKHIKSALSNVATASKCALEEANSSSLFNIDYLDGKQVLTVSQRPHSPPITLKLQTPPDLHRRISENLSAGLPFQTKEFLTLTSNQPIFDGVEAQISFNPNNSRSAEIQLFNDELLHEKLHIPGTIRFGQTQITFAGSLGKGYANITLTQKLTEGEPDNRSEINIQWGTTSQWEGLPLAILPEFPKLCLFSRILKSQKPCIELFVEGYLVMGFSANGIGKNLNTETLDALDTVIFIDRELSLNGRFKQLSFENIDFALLNFVKTLSERGILEEISEATIKLKVSPCSLTIDEVQSRSNEPCDIMITKPVESIEFFDKEILIPQIKIVFKKAVISVEQGEPLSITVSHNSGQMKLFSLMTSLRDTNQKILQG